MTIDLKGKKALVTGASGQLGRVMARTLAACGADVALNYFHNKTMAENIKEEIEKLGRRAMAVQADITDETEVYKMRDKIYNDFGQVDIVVNNAVIQYEWTTILEQNIHDFRSQFDSCIMQSVLTAKAFMPAMTDRKAGRFIGINTECYALCERRSGAYAAAKSGMNSLYQVLAKEVGESGITVNQVSPGWTISDRHREEKTDDSAYAATVPLKRRGTDQEIANVVLFLASDLSSYVTGVNIPVCGGRVMV